MTELSAAERETMSIRDILGLQESGFLWLGQIVSNFGDALTHLTLILLIHRIAEGSTLPKPEQQKSAPLTRFSSWLSTRVNRSLFLGLQ